MISHWSRVWTTQSRSPSISLSCCKENNGWELLQYCTKTMDREPPSFKIGDRIYFKNRQPGKWDLKWRPGYKIIHIECDGHYLHIENQASGKIRSCNIKDKVLEPPGECWNINTQFSRAGKYINYPANLPTIMLNDWRWTPTHVNSHL